MSPEERQLVASSYKNSMPTAVTHVLELLTAPARGLIFSPGITSSRRRCFASKRILRPEDAGLPEVVTVRERVVVLVRHAVRELGRAVRLTDIVAFADGRPEYARLTPAMIENAVKQAHSKGELAVLAMRGNLRNLYVPAELNPADYAPPKPLSWLEWVRAALDSLWDEHVQEAREQGRLPRPVTTRQVRARLLEMGCDDPKMTKTAGVVSALFDLSENNTPTIRRICRRSRKSLFWCPAGIGDLELDLNAYATDAERIGVTVARAAARLERPVTLREIEAEMEADPSLRVKNPATFKALNSAVEYVGRDGRIKPQREYAPGVVLSVGRVRGRALYYPPGRGVDQALGYVEFRQLEQQWKDLRADEQLYDLQGCRLPTVALGRARFLAWQSRYIVGRLRGMIASSELVGQWADEAETLIDRVDAVAEQAGKWPTPVGGQALPEHPITVVPTFTKDELRELLRPIYPTIRRLERAYKITSLLITRIRRIAPFLGGYLQYDRTDTLLFAARRFGGRECVFLAGLAAPEIGMLRDASFIFPAAEAADPDMRLVAVACMAFVWSEEGNKLLKKRAMTDNEPGIRQSALWAASFAGADMAHELATVMAKHDESAEVREFAAQVAAAEGAEIWLL
ncbi:MAG TPA: hypothetical protein VF297_18315 [Pyrinomonadaceae bacterium]